VKKPRARPLKKLAIFVEGMTEGVFVEKLIREMIDEREVRIEVFEASGGGSSPRRISLIRRNPVEPDQLYYVQIVESTNDERVASDVRDNYDQLARAGFAGIIAIRDVYPDHTAAEIPALRKALRYRLRTKPIDPLFVLGIMEIEAWFIAEHTHFSRIHAGLTLARIIADVGFDPSSEDMQARPCPHDDLHTIYQLEGMAYRKKKRSIQRTVERLDYNYVYFELVNNFPDLQNLTARLDYFFTVAQ
jgi:hypothetical protein